MQPSPDTASFFMPGIVHQFGNLLLTMQGHALQLDGSSLDDTREAMLTAVQRGADSLLVLRVLLGEPVHGTAEPCDLLSQLAELARVPVRERGMTLEVFDETAAPVAPVATATFVAGLAAAIRAWASAVPVGAAGTISLRLLPDGVRGCRVVIGFAAAAGSLPFPVAAAAAAAELSQQICAEELTVTAVGDGVELQVPATPISSPGQA